ncbi:MAG: transglutaminase-like domain-containing protein [Planctomycetota bacterium]
MSSAHQLRLAHCLFLAAFAGWLAASQNDGLLPALCVAGLTTIGEWLRPGAWRELGTPVLALIGTALGWWLGGNTPGALHALLGTLVAALVLMPARPGVLRLIAPLCAFELVILGLPGVQHPPVWIVVLVLVPMACIALALDAWLQARHGARSNPNEQPGKNKGLLRWALAPAALAALIGLLIFAPSERVAEWMRPKPVRDAGSTAEGAHSRTQPRPGGSSSNGHDVGIDAGRPPPRDPLPTARLLLPNDPGEVVYLRGAACSHLVRDVDTGRWRWSPALGEAQLSTEPPAANIPRGDLVRMAGLGDIVLLPDDGDWAQVDDIWIDGDRNRWRVNLGEAVRAYRVATGHQPRREPESDLALARATCRELPPALSNWPWASIERPEWRGMPPEIAANAIAITLRGRCTYDLDLPQGQSEPVATFLFSEDAHLRRGTCEYFAGAAALLLRRAGHSVRCVTGYASAEWDGNGIIFRGLHAHAWIEVLREDGCWIRCEPTPRVAFDLATQGMDPTRSAVPDPNAAIPLKPLPRYGVIIAAALAGIVVLLLIARRLRAARLTRKPDPQRVFRQRGEELVRIARQLGIRVMPGDTARIICAGLTKKTGVSLGEQLAAYEAARFGTGADPGPWPAELLNPRAP